MGALLSSVSEGVSSRGLIVGGRNPRIGDGVYCSHQSGMAASDHVRRGAGDNRITNGIAYCGIIFEGGDSRLRRQRWVDMARTSMS